MNILISSVGRRVSLVRIFKDELLKVYPKGKVFAVDMQPELSSACQVADGSFKVPHVSDPTYFDTLLAICRSNKITLIIPTIDTELALLAKNEKLFLNYGIIPVVSTIGFIDKCRDKRKIHSFLEAHNINIAKEFSKYNFEYPFFIKPYDGSRSVDTYLIKSEKDLTDYHLNNEKLMFLEYLDHDLYEEYTCDLYYNKKHELKCAVPRKRIEVRDGEVNKGMTENNALVPYIKEHLSVIDGARGCLTAQFFKHKENNRIVGIEINPRFGGGFPLTYLAGANYPKWIIDEYLFGKEIDENFDCWENNLLMLRYDDEVLVHNYTPN
jgi:carbamoyl-phosphate synthase large subunit